MGKNIVIAYYNWLCITTMCIAPPLEWLGAGEQAGGLQAVAATGL